MNKPELTSDGILSYQIMLEDLDSLYSVLAYTLKKLNEAIYDDGDGYSGIDIKETFEFITQSNLDEFYEAGQKVDTPDLDFILSYDIKWMLAPLQEQIIKGIDQYIEIIMHTYWTEPGDFFQFLITPSRDEFGFRVQSSGQLVGWDTEEYFDMDDDDRPFTFVGDAQELALLGDDLLSTEETSGEEERSQESIQPTQTALLTDDSIEAIMNDFINRVVGGGELVHPLTPGQWQELLDVLKGAAFLAHKEMNGEFIQDRSKEVANFLYESEKGQLLASLYLLTNSVSPSKSGQRIERLREVTALLRYYDWMNARPVPELQDKVNDTILNMTTSMLSGRI